MKENSPELSLQFKRNITSVILAQTVACPLASKYHIPSFGSRRVCLSHEKQDQTPVEIPDSFLPSLHILSDISSFKSLFVLCLLGWLFLHLSGLFAWTGPSCLSHQQLHLLPRAFCLSQP